uniref:Uncharacterized protein n=1 Tax=Glossina pallidipes TaxID=7398 RepID=A0A1A9Z767_GLOPL
MNATGIICLIEDKNISNQIQGKKELESNCTVVDLGSALPTMSSMRTCDNVVGIAAVSDTSILAVDGSGCSSRKRSEAAVYVQDVHDAFHRLLDKKLSSSSSPKGLISDSATFSQPIRPPTLRLFKFGKRFLTRGDILTYTYTRANKKSENIILSHRSTN